MTGQDSSNGLRRALSSGFLDFLRIAAIVVPWLCALALPLPGLDRFASSDGSYGGFFFFEFVMMPLGNLAMLGIGLCCRGVFAWQNALFAFAGVVAPVALSLLFAAFWRRRQFVFVWLGYVALVVWNAVVAALIVSPAVIGGAIQQ